MPSKNIYTSLINNLDEHEILFELLRDDDFDVEFGKKSFQELQSTITDSSKTMILDVLEAFSLVFHEIEATKNNNKKKPGSSEDIDTSSSPFKIFSRDNSQEMIDLKDAQNSIKERKNLPNSKTPPERPPPPKKKLSENFFNPKLFDAIYFHLSQIHAYQSTEIDNILVQLSVDVALAELYTNPTTCHRNPELIYLMLNHELYNSVIFNRNFDREGVLTRNNSIAFGNGQLF